MVGVGLKLGLKLTIINTAKRLVETTKKNGVSSGVSHNLKIGVRNGLEI